MFEASLVKKLDDTSAPELGRGDLQTLDEKVRALSKMDFATSRYLVPKSRSQRAHQKHADHIPAYFLRNLGTIEKRRSLKILRFCL